MKKGEISMKRRVFVMAAVVALSFVLVGCQESQEDKKEVASAAPTETVTEAPTEIPTEEPTEAPTEEPTEIPTEGPTEVPTDTPADETSNGEKTGESTGDWTDMKFTFDGVNYKIPCSYESLKKNGWSFNLADYGHKDGYSLNPGDKVIGTIKLVNGKYDKFFSCTVGFINLTEKPQDITKCDIWVFEINTAFGSRKLDNIPQMEIAKGIKIGSSKEEVEKAFGKCDDVYEAKESGYVKYTYKVDYQYYLKLIIYEDAGVRGIELSDYRPKK